MVSELEAWRSDRGSGWLIEVLVGRNREGMSDKQDCQLRIGSQRRIVSSENKSRAQNHGRFRGIRRSGGRERNEQVWVGEVEELKRVSSGMCNRAGRQARERGASAGF